jgi:phospholipid-translocating ATPase
MFIALLPRYLYKAWKFGFAPDDIDILRYLYKTEPERDLAHDPSIRNPLLALKRSRTQSMASRTRSRHSVASVASLPPTRPSMDLRSASRTDMSTGLRSVHRGFDFATEENGVAMHRMQSRLSERRESSRNLATGGAPHRRGTLGHVLSVPRNFLRKKASAHTKEPSQ